MGVDVVPDKSNFSGLSAELTADARLGRADLDGCLTSEGRPVPDACGFGEACGDRLCVLSNNSSHIAEALSAELAAMGLRVAGDQTLCHRHAIMVHHSQHRASDAWGRPEEVPIGSAYDEPCSITVSQTHEWRFERLWRNTRSRLATTEAFWGDARPAMPASRAPVGPEPWTRLNQHIALIARRSADDPSGGSHND